MTDQKQTDSVSKKLVRDFLNTVFGEKEVEATAVDVDAEIDELNMSNELSHVFSALQTM